MTFIENLGWRYAAKSFGGGMVSQENLDKILNAIKMAPTSFGTQPFHVHVVSNRKMLQDLKIYSKDNEKKLETCSYLLVFSARTDIQSRFLGIEKIKGMRKSFLAKSGFVMQYFLPIVSYFKMGRMLTKKTWARNQAYIPLGFALAACAELKIDSCPMEGFNSVGYKKLLGMPTHFYPSVILAIGTRDENDSALKYPKARFPNEDLFTQI
jgi:nitroreductase